MAASLKARGNARPAANGGKDADVRQPLPLHAGARLTARVALAVALLVAALWTASDFLPALLWAVILAVTIWPGQAWLTERLPGRSDRLAAFLLTAAVGFLLFLPLALAGYQLAQQNQWILSWIGQARDNGIPVPEWVARLPMAADAVRDWWQSNLTDPRSATEWLKSFNLESASGAAQTLGGQLLHRAFLFFLALIALFALLRNGRELAAQVLATADRILGEPGEGLAEKMVAAVRGTVNGTIVVAVAEGLLIGVGYGIAGVPGAMVLTVLTIAFAMLPFGAWAAFTLAAITLVASGGSVGVACLVFGWGAIVMLAGDHFVWPTLVGSAARLPFLLAFVGIFGGLASFGLLGLFLGPVIMAALLTVWREWVLRAPRTAEAAPR